MTVTWIVSNLEHEISDGAVMVSHWQAVDSEVVGEGDEAVTYSGRSYGTVGFTPDSSSSSYVPYAEITQEMAIGWTKDSLGEEQVASIEASIAAQIDAEKNPTQEAGVPW
jgi:hypothetical protein